MKWTVAILSLLSAFSPSLALAWGEDGHSIVADIAQHRLTAGAQSAVQLLLKSEYPPSLGGAFSDRRSRAKPGGCEI
jgi:hypothetical protein